MQAEDSRALRDLERTLGQTVPPVVRFDYRHFGYREEEGRVVALELQGRDLAGLPESLGELAGLRSLHLNRNRLRRLPQGIGALRSLEYLVLNGNLLEAVPDSIVRLGRLKTLRLQANP